MQLSDFKTTLRNRIEKAIQESGYTQEEIAARMGSSSSVLSRWVSGQWVPDCVEVVRLADATGQMWLADLRDLTAGSTDGVSEPPTRIGSSGSR